MLTSVNISYRSMSLSVSYFWGLLLNFSFCEERRLFNDLWDWTSETYNLTHRRSEPAGGKNSNLHSWQFIQHEGPDAGVCEAHEDEKSQFR